MKHINKLLSRVLVLVALIAVLFSPVLTSANSSWTTVGVDSSSPIEEIQVISSIPLSFDSGTSYTLTWQTPKTGADFYWVGYSNRLFPGSHDPGEQVSTLPGTSTSKTFVVSDKMVNQYLWYNMTKGTGYSEESIRKNFIFYIHADKSTTTNSYGMKVVANAEVGPFVINSKQVISPTRPITPVASPVSSTGIQSGDINPNNGAQNYCLDLSVNLAYKSRDVQTNNAVSDLQDFLQTLGYLNQEPTGYFGQLTLLGVKKYQADNGLSATGYVGPLTRAKIKARSCTNTGLRPSASSSTSNTSPMTQPATYVTDRISTSIATTPSQVSTVLGCSYGAMYSSLTGQLCSGATKGSVSTPVTTTSTYQTPVFNRNMEMGSMGADVIQLQNFLEAKGFLVIPPGVAKGAFDISTKNALAAYQVATGISPADGVFGPVTRASLNANSVTTTQVVTPPQNQNSLPVVQDYNNGQRAYMRVESQVAHEEWGMDSRYNVLWSYGYLDQGGKFQITLTNNNKTCYLGDFTTRTGTATVAPSSSVKCTETGGTYMGSTLTPGIYKVTLGYVDSTGQAKLSDIDSTGQVTLYANASSIPTTVVLTPKAGETYKQGQTVTIKWTPGGSGISYINFYKDDSSYSVAFRPRNAPDPSGSGLFVFPQNMPVGNYKVYAFYELTVNGVISSKKLYDGGDSYFTIVPVVTTPTVPIPPVVVTVPKADIAIMTPVCTPQSAQKGEQFSCVVTVYNNSSSVDITTPFQISGVDTSVTVDSPLNVGQKKEVTLTGVITNAQTRTYTFTADSTNVLDEGYENNNTSTFQYYPAGTTDINAPAKPGATYTTDVNKSISFVGGFAGYGQNGVKSTTWVFGDGATDIRNYSSQTASGGVAAYHAYTQAGTYTVTLQLTTLTGITITSEPVYVTVN